MFNSQSEIFRVENSMLQVAETSSANMEIQDLDESSDEEEEKR
jgi:hypothetical protein